MPRTMPDFSVLYLQGQCSLHCIPASVHGNLNACVSFPVLFTTSLHAAFTSAPDPESLSIWIIKQKTSTVTLKKKKKKEKSSSTTAGGLWNVSNNNSLDAENIWISDRFRLNVPPYYSNGGEGEWKEQNVPFSFSDV